MTSQLKLLEAVLTALRAYEDFIRTNPSVSTENSKLKELEKELWAACANVGIPSATPVSNIRAKVKALQKEAQDSMNKAALKLNIHNTRQQASHSGSPSGSSSKPTPK